MIIGMIFRGLASVMLGISDYFWDLAIALNPKIKVAAAERHPAGRKLYVVKDKLG